MYILSVDFGTSALKMEVMDEQFTSHGVAKITYDYEVVNRTHVQIDADLIYGAFLKGCAQLHDVIPKVECVAFCVMAPCLVVMDKDGTPLLPAILHLDRRSYKQSRFAVRELGKETFLRINGNLPFAGGVSCTSMLWVKDNCPEIYEKAHMLGHLNTYMHKKFTNRFVIDPSNASFSALYETYKLGAFSRTLVDGLGLDMNKLPEIVDSLTVAGPLTESVARESGLKSGIPVLMGANDTTAAAYGAGAVNTGDILNLSGSNEIITITNDHPKPHEKLYIRASMERGKWLYLTITVGGFALEWFYKQFCRDMTLQEFYAYVSEVVSQQLTPTARFLPHLSGDRHSLQPKKGAFTRLTLDTTREELLTALLIGTFEPIVSALGIAGGEMTLNRDVFFSGGMSGEPLQRFKENLFKGFTFKARRECSTYGNIKAVKTTLGL